MARPFSDAHGRAELRQVLGRQRVLLLLVVLFSAFVNLLMITGPLFMMQVYDRVLGSGSEATLLALFVLVSFLYGSMAVLDVVRSQILARGDALPGGARQAGLRRRAAPAGAGTG